MSLLLPLPPQCREPYRPTVPRLPKNFHVESMSIDLLSPRGYLATGPNTAVPRRFEAHFVLTEPDASVTIEVFVGADLRPVVIGLRMRANAQTPITTSGLRRVLIDQMVVRAMEKATVPASVREEWLASLPAEFRTPAPTASDNPAASAAANKRGRADADARAAAEIYLEALATGSKAPGVAVANRMNRSRAQVARYIRRARELGLLPPLKPEGS